MGEIELGVEPKSRQERRALFVALWLNIALAASLMAAGVFGDSSGLIANALDNASDATVYAISFYAVKRGPYWKARAAQFSGTMLLLLCAGVLVDVIRRFVLGAQPIGAIMIAMSLVAAVTNLVCLRVLRALRHDDVNLRAAWTFSVNDLLSNIGVLAAAVLVAWLGHSWPDLVVGLAIAGVAAKGGIEILSDAQRTLRGSKATP